jgi:hypothetical protein
MSSKHFGPYLLTAATLLATSPPLAAQDAAPHWSDTLKNMGTVYSNPDADYIQKVKLFGRFHYQYNYSDGESAGQDFSGDGDEVRRLRAGGSVDFLDGFKVLGRMNLIERGAFFRTDLGFSSWDELYVEYGRKDWLGFDSASIGYGRYKLLFGGEEHQSSKRIKTIERSAINNRFGSRRPTGAVLKAEKNGVDYVFGVWSSEIDLESWSGWGENVAVQGSAEFDALDGRLLLDFIYADNSRLDLRIFNYNWATSVTYNRTFSRGHLMANATVSDDRRGDPLGIVLLPSVYLIPDKLEAAFRYQWSHASGDRLAPTSSGGRGLRAIALEEGVFPGAGSDYQALYAGLNYYLAGDNLKFMAGLEYEDISGISATELDGLTFWLAFRTFF